MWRTFTPCSWSSRARLAYHNCVRDEAGRAKQWHKQWETKMNESWEAVRGRKRREGGAGRRGGICTCGEVREQGRGLLRAITAHELRKKHVSA